LPHTTAKDLIGKLLVRDPDQRPSAQQILMHPWITTAELMDGLESSSIDLGTAPSLIARPLRLCEGDSPTCLVFTAVKLAEYNVKRKEEKAELVNVLSAPI
jgi:serine/threonine protein kinase